MRRRITILTVIAAFAATLVLPFAAQASTKGRRNTALLATGAAAYLLAKGKTTQGLAAGAGAAYAWKRYSDARKHETRYRSYRRGYRAGYGSGHDRGYHKGYYRGKGHSKRYCRHRG